MQAFKFGEKKPVEKKPINVFTSEDTPFDVPAIQALHKSVHDHQYAYSSSSYAEFAQKEVTDVWSYIVTTGFPHSSHLTNDNPRPLWYDMPTMSSLPPSLCGGKVNIGAFLSPLNGEVMNYYCDLSAHANMVRHTVWAADNFAKKIHDVQEPMEKPLKEPNDLVNRQRQFSQALTSVIRAGVSLIKAERNHDIAFIRVEAQRSRLLETIAGVSRATFPRGSDSKRTSTGPSIIQGNIVTAADAQAKPEADAKERYYAREADDMSTESRNLFRVMGASMLCSGLLMPKKRAAMKEKWPKLVRDVIATTQWLFATQKFVYHFPGPAELYGDSDLSKDELALFLVCRGPLPEILQGLAPFLYGSAENTTSQPAGFKAEMSKSEMSKMAPREECAHCQIDEKSLQSEKSRLLDGSDEVGDCSCKCHDDLPAYTEPPDACL